MDEVDDLKPCPFCGGRDIHVDRYRHGCGQDRLRVVCADCMGQVNSGTWQTAEPAIEAWNARFERTCTYDQTTSLKSGEVSLRCAGYVCSECGHGSMTAGFEYCPSCGRKVVEQ